jgi:hypothetical protein
MPTDAISMPSRSRRQTMPEDQLADIGFALLSRLAARMK